MTLRVTCQAADLIPLGELDNFQGAIKKISDANLQKLKDRIVRDGINVPVFVWPHMDSNYLLDGHQRIKALTALQEEGYDVPPVPVAYIDAKDISDAKEKLLAITSQYGQFDIEELNAWLDELDDTVAETLRLVDTEVWLGEMSEPGDDFFEDADSSDNEPEPVTCPECGHTFMP